MTQLQSWSQVVSNSILPKAPILQAPVRMWYNRGDRFAPHAQGPMKYWDAMNKHESYRKAIWATIQPTPEFIDQHQGKDNAAFLVVRSMNILGHPDGTEDDIWAEGVARVARNWDHWNKRHAYEAIGYPEIWTVTWTY